MTDEERQAAEQLCKALEAATGRTRTRYRTIRIVRTVTLQGAVKALRRLLAETKDD